MAEKTTGTPVSTRQRLPWSLILIFLLLASAIAVSGYLFYQKQKKDALHDQIANLQAIADLKVPADQPLARTNRLAMPA